MGLQVNTDPGTTLQVAKISTFHTTGADMAGMKIKANFSGIGSSTSSNTWVKTSATAGRTLSGPQKSWSLSQDGDTFTNEWTLVNKSNVALKSIEIDGLPGDTLFDMTDPSPGTANSSGGKTFTPTGGTDANFEIVVTYRDRVELLTGGGPVGDLYRKMRIDFKSKGAAFKKGSTLTFIADTDSIAIAHTPSDD